MGEFCSHCLMRVAFVMMRFARYLKLEGALIRYFVFYKALFNLMVFDFLFKDYIFVLTMLNFCMYKKCLPFW